MSSVLFNIVGELGTIVRTPASDVDVGPLVAEITGDGNAAFAKDRHLSVFRRKVNVEGLTRGSSMKYCT